MFSQASSYDAYNIRARRVLEIPTACGAPAVNTSIKFAALYFDSCNDKLYKWNHVTSAWTEVVSTGGGGSSYYQTVKTVGTSVTQRPSLNFSGDFTAVDNSSNNRTDIALQSVPWSIVNGTPTTIAGYGITDAVSTGTSITINGTTYDLSANRSWSVGDLLSSGSYSNPSWITALGWSKITGTPTTLSGYGISDAVGTGRTITINATTYDLSANRSWSVGDLVSSGSYSNPSWLTALAWSKVTGTPTTLSGYGITDGLTGTGVTGATKTKITYNSNGLITSGADATTSDIAEGSNLYWTTARFDARLALKSTSDLTEGSNLYYTDARARAAITANAPISISSGVISLDTTTLGGGVHTRGYYDARYAAISGAPYWNLGGTSTLTSANTIAGAFPNQISFTPGYNVTTANNQSAMTINLNTTLRATASETYTGISISGNIKKGASGQSGIGLDINIADSSTNIGALYGIRTNKNIMPSASATVDLGVFGQTFKTLYMDNSTGQIMNSLFRSWNSSTYFDWTYQGSTLSHMKILSGGNWKIGYNINTTDSLYAGQIRGDLSTVGSIHIEPLKEPVISAVISQIGGGAATINYKVVVRTVDGRHSAASSSASVTNSVANITGSSNRNNITLTAQVDGEYYVDLYRISSTGTSGNTAINGKIYTFTGRGIQAINTITDNGAAGDGTTPPADNNSGSIGVGIERPTAFVHIKGSVAGAEGGQIKLDNGVSQTTAEPGVINRVDPQMKYTNNGGIEQEFLQSQQSRVSTQFDKTSSTTLANITGLTASLAAGHKYRFQALLYTTSVNTGGIKFAIGGTCTATNIIYDSYVSETGLMKTIGTSRATALATTVSDVTSSTAGYATITGTITVNAAGTLTVQFAQNNSDGTASSVLVGSTFVVIEMP